MEEAGYGRALRVEAEAALALAGGGDTIIGDVGSHLFTLKRWFQCEQATPIRPFAPFSTESIRFVGELFPATEIEADVRLKRLPINGRSLSVDHRFETVLAIMFQPTETSGSEANRETPLGEVAQAALWLIDL